MDRINKLLVRYNGKIVGAMALYKTTLAAFEYDKGWLAEGFSISPFSQPLEQRVFMPKLDPFEGLYGVFSDSLPDGWEIDGEEWIIKFPSSEDAKNIGEQEYNRRKI